MIIYGGSFRDKSAKFHLWAERTKECEVSVTPNQPGRTLLVELHII